jgi:predicted aconitase
MRLTDREKQMLNGENGEPVRKAMEILIALGKIYDADDMIPIQSAHVAGLSFKSHGDAGLEWVENMADDGAKVRVPTTLNVIGVDRSRDFGLPMDWTRKQMRIGAGYERMGCFGTSTCVPYYCGFIPRMKEHIAWAESSAIVFVNSFLGARDNREGGPSALAAALAGCTPRYGLHLDENRKGKLLVNVAASLEGLADFGALGAYVGKRVGTDIPVFSGIERMDVEDHVYLGAALASSGAVALYHVLGITPETLLGKSVLADKYETIEFSNKEMELGREQLTSGGDRKVDYVAIGCPHCSLRQLAELARLLSGKKVNQNVTLWIHTNAAIKGMAKQLGYMEIIERSGAALTQDLCTILSCPEDLGFKNIATNSAKMAFYAPGGNKFNVWYGNVKQCIDAAVSGRWKF